MLVLPFMLRGYPDNVEPTDLEVSALRGERWPYS
jgi:hypothetical protein